MSSSAQAATLDTGAPSQILGVGAVTPYSLKWLNGDLQHLGQRDRIEESISALTAKIKQGEMLLLGTDDAGVSRYQVGNLPNTPHPSPTAQVTFQPIPNAPHIKHLTEVNILQGARTFTYSCPIHQFKGESYAMASLGGNLFVKSLEPLHISAKTTPPEFQARTSGTNQHMATELFAKAQARMLKNDIQTLQDHTVSLVNSFKTNRSNPNHRKISEAVQTYADFDIGFHVLMNAANHGYPSAEAFFREAYPERCMEEGEDTTDDCIEEFMNGYRNLEERSPDDLKQIYNDELKVYAKTLFDFVSKGASLQGITIAHAIKNKTPHAQETLKALIEGKPVCFDGFLSGSADLELLMEFDGSDALPNRADNMVDTRDKSAIARLIKHDLINEIDNADEQQWSRSYITFIGTCGDTKGVFLDGGTTDGKDEDEVLQNPGKVLIPQQVLRMHEEATGDRHYVVLGQIEPMRP